LYQRGFTTHADALRFLAGQVPLADPFRMKGVPEAVARLRSAIRKGEQIAVFGDFDADGVTSTALLVTALKALGARVTPYIPSRVDEGYGLNSEALYKLRHEFEAAVVVTVDCGIRSLKEVADGTSYGLDMIVTDHHSVGPDLPVAYAVINPKQPGCNYGEDMLAGVGIAYRLADALFRAAAANGKPAPFPVEDLLDLVAIGTVADLAPLDRLENRTLVQQGLERIRSNPRPGIKALLNVSGTEQEATGADTIGFRLGPRINAAGRLESAGPAYRLLAATTLEAAIPYATQLNNLNARRQDLTEQMQQRALQLVGEPQNVPLIFAASTEFLQGIVGLVAGKLTEQFYRPSVILHQDAEESHGSCRSIEGFNITEALDACADLLLRHGGHAQAAGFAILNENIPLLRERLMQIADERISESERVPTLHVDAQVRLHELTEDLFHELHRLDPCGAENSAPILCSTGLRVVSKRTVGKDGSHLKLQFADYDCQVNAIAFRMGGIIDALWDRVDVAYKLDVNEFNGKKELQLVVEDIRPATA
jgi:single-stranded-DNA-specific exonuclease